MAITKDNILIPIVRYHSDGFMVTPSTQALRIKKGMIVKIHDPSSEHFLGYFNEDDNIIVEIFKIESKNPLKGDYAIHCRKDNICHVLTPTQFGKVYIEILGDDELIRELWT